MILHQIKKNLFTFLGKWFIAISAVYVINLIPELQMAKALNLKSLEFILLAISDQYYILFFLIISFIFSILKVVNIDEQEVLIRSDKYIKYYCAQIISVVIISFVFVALHVFIASVMSSILDFGNSFSNKDSNEITTFYSTVFNTPLAGISCVAIYMISGLSFMGALIIFIKRYFKIHMIVIFTAAIYLIAILGFQVEYKEILSVFFLNNYIILHQAIKSSGNMIYILYINMAFVIALMILIIKKFWYKELNLNIKMRTKNNMYLSKILSKKNFVIISISIFIIIAAGLISEKNMNFNDLIFYCYWGHGTGYFDIMEFLRMLIFNGVPIYLLCVFLQKDSTERSSTILIRLEKTKRWYNSIVISAFTFIVIYIFLSIFISAAVSLIMGTGFQGYGISLGYFEFYDTNVISPWLLFLESALGRILELFFQFMLVFLIYCLSNKAIFGFLFLQILSFLSTLSLFVIKFLPVGITSLSRWKEITGTGLYFWQLILYLVIVISLAHLYMRYKGHKKIFV